MSFAFALSFIFLIVVLLNDPTKEGFFPFFGVFQIDIQIIHVRFCARRGAQTDES